MTVVPVPPPAAGMHPTRFGVVVIGRNEGERLRSCLRSVLSDSRRVVYVDSGSQDGSIEMASALGVDALPLDMGVPFTAARARNVGWRRLVDVDAALDYIQFVDGDCEVVPGWMPGAQRFLDEHADVAAVTGWRRERFPQQSVYNRLCDIEWTSGVVGETKSFGGDAMIRVRALLESGGYRDDLIAGEDDEICIRMRARSWRIWRLDSPMTLHDAAMTRLSQWWNRCMRAGYAYAEGVRLHGRQPERHFIRQWRSAWLWGLGIPLLLLAASVWVGPLAFLGLLVYPLQVLRLFSNSSGSRQTRAERSIFLVLGKFAEAAGLVKAALHRVSGQGARLIEYK